MTSSKMNWILEYRRFPRWIQNLTVQKGRPMRETGFDDLATGASFKSHMVHPQLTNIFNYIKSKNALFFFRSIFQFFLQNVTSPNPSARVDFGSLLTEGRPGSSSSRSLPNKPVWTVHMGPHGFVTCSEALRSCGALKCGKIENKAINNRIFGH